jgi:hypothetical protein
MPCFDSRNDADVMRESFRHNSDVAEMLCALCTKYANYFGHNKEPYPSTEKGVLNDVHPGLFAWWEEHKKRDAQKKKDERRRNAMVLAKAEIASVAKTIMRKHGL